MHAMLIDSQPRRLERMQIAFLEAGIHVTGSGSLAVAECCLRRAVVDILLIEEPAGGHRLAEIIGLAQSRNPRLITILLTSDVLRSSSRLAARFESLHRVLEDDSDPRLVARQVLEAAGAPDNIRARRPEPAKAVFATETALSTTPPMPDGLPVFQSSRRRMLPAQDVFSPV